jgi:flagellar biogenesis protein FliO
MNFKAGFDRLSLLLTVLSVPIAFWILMEMNNWRGPQPGEARYLLLLLAVIAVSVWGVTRLVGWVVRGFTQPHREPPA